MHYNHFRVGPATDIYRLSIYIGYIATGITPTDPFTTGLSIDGQPFSTHDRDNDKNNNDKSGSHCALKSHGSTTPGGWWHNYCFYINLNYNYGAPNGFIRLAGIWYNPKFIEIKFVLLIAKCSDIS